MPTTEELLRMSVLVEEDKKRGFGWEDCCVRHKVFDPYFRKLIRACVLESRSSCRDEGAAGAGVAGHHDQITGCPIIERGER